MTTASVLRSSPFCSVSLVPSCRCIGVSCRRAPRRPLTETLTYLRTAPTTTTADLAAQLAAGLGLNVVSPSSPSAPGGAGAGERAADAVAVRDETEVGWAVGGDEELLTAEQEEDEGEAGGEGAAGRLGGWFDDGQNASRRERTRAIRKEEKEGKSAEKVRGGRSWVKLDGYMYIHRCFLSSCTPPPPRKKAALCAEVLSSDDVRRGDVCRVMNERTSL